METINAKLLTLPTSLGKNPGLSSNKIPKHSGKERFLKGPIPLKWICEATRLPGQTWNVATAIWYLVGLNNSPTIKLTQTVLNQFGITRYAKYRALNELEATGLIKIDSSHGKNPVVTVLELR